MDKLGIHPRNVELAQSAPLVARDCPPADGRAVHGRVVDHGEGAFPGSLDVQLQRVRPELQREIEGRDRVLGRLGGCAPVGDDGGSACLHDDPLWLS